MDGIELLKQEHKQIRDALQILKKSKREDLPDILNKISGLMEIIHHEKEELYLFKAAYESGLVQQGGPRCVFFMGLKIENDIVVSIKDFLTKNKAPFQENFSVPLSKKLKAENHPLSIPLEEHLAGISLMQFMKSMPDSKLMVEAIEFYCQLIELHSQKEDECLFEMLKTLLSQEVREQMAKDFEAFDKKWNKDRYLVV